MNIELKLRVKNKTLELFKLSKEKMLSTTIQADFRTKQIQNKKKEKKEKKEKKKNIQSGI